MQGHVSSSTEFNAYIFYRKTEKEMHVTRQTKENRLSDKWFIQSEEKHISTASVLFKLTQASNSQLSTWIDKHTNFKICFKIPSATLLHTEYSLVIITWNIRCLSNSDMKYCSGHSNTLLAFVAGWFSVCTLHTLLILWLHVPICRFCVWYA